MFMKRFVLHIILSIITLCTATAAAPTASALKFDTLHHDFGTIREQDGKVSHTFGFVNAGRKPVVILTVQTTCGCTVASFSKRPVMPGQRGEITLTYNPADRPGVFTRDADVYGSDRTILATLRIEGNVEPRERSIAELYPFDLGGGLRSSATFVPFGYVAHGEPKQSYIDIANTSSRDIKLNIKWLQSSGLLSAEMPSTLSPGGRGEIRLTYSAAEGSGRCATADDMMSIEVDGRESDYRLTTNAIVVSQYRPDAKFPAPQANIDRNTVSFGTVRHSAGTQTITAAIGNNGGEPLRIDAVETVAGISAGLAPGTLIAPGDELQFVIVLNPSQAGYGFMSQRIRIFTNDPVRPMRQIRITATIED